VDGISTGSSNARSRQSGSDRRLGGRPGSARQARQIIGRAVSAESALRELAQENRLLNDATAELAARLRIPLRGYGEQLGAASGFWADGWIGSQFEVRITPELKVRHVEVRLWQPAERWQVQTLDVAVNALHQPLALWPGQSGRLSMRTALPASQPFLLSIKAPSSWRAPEGDGRELVAQLLGVWLWH